MIQFAGESAIRSNIGLQYKIGVLSPLIKPFSIKYANNTVMYGGRLKTEIRSYKHDYLFNLNIRKFWGRGLQFQQIVTNFDGIFLINSPTLNLQIIETVYTSVSDIGLYTMHGYQYFFNNSLMIELNLVGGVRRRTDFYLMPLGFEHYAPNDLRNTTHVLFQTGIYVGYTF